MVAEAWEGAAVVAEAQVVVAWAAAAEVVVGVVAVAVVAVATGAEETAAVCKVGVEKVAVALVEEGLEEEAMGASQVDVATAAGRVVAASGAADKAQVFEEAVELGVASKAAPWEGLQVAALVAASRGAMVGAGQVEAVMVVKREAATVERIHDRADCQGVWSRWRDRSRQRMSPSPNADACRTHRAPDAAMRQMSPVQTRTQRERPRRTCSSRSARSGSAERCCM